VEPRFVLPCQVILSANFALTFDILAVAWRRKFRSSKMSAPESSQQPIGPAWLLYSLPKIEDLIFVVLFLAVLGLGSRLMNVDGDLGRHLTIGNYILDTRSIPLNDIFSHTMTGMPLTPHEWLAQVFFALAYRLAGLNGVILLCALLIASAFRLVYRQAQANSQLLLAALFWTILAAAVSSLHWLARPHLFTLLLAPVWAGQLEHIRKGKTKRWWILPVVMFVWANLHGAFLVGFAVWGMYLIAAVLDARLPQPERIAGHTQVESGEKHKKWSTVRSLLTGGIFSLLATLLNPAGFRLWQTGLGFLGSRYLVDHTAEYLSPDFHQAYTWPFLLMIGAGLVILGFARVRLPATWVFMIAGWTIMALYSVRNVPLFAVLVSPLLAGATPAALDSFPNWGLLQRLNQRLTDVDRLLRGMLWPVGTAILATLALLIGMKLDFSQSGNRFDATVFPVQAVNWLQIHPPQGNMFNDFTWGGYLLFRLWPNQRVFIDGQTDFYGETLTRQYEQIITQSDGWQAILDRYQVSWMILPTASPLSQKLYSDRRWSVSYRDSTAVIFSRRDYSP
jgi:hypothetical protein